MHALNSPAASSSSKSADRSACPRCESLPQIETGPGRLFVKPPLAHTFGKVKANAHQAGLAPVRDGEALSVRIGDGPLDVVVEALGQGLTVAERQDVRVLFQRDGQEFSISDYLSSESLEAFAARVGSGWLRDMLAEERMTVLFQPIVRCTPDHPVFAYECLMRGIDPTGALVSPGRILSTAKSAELLFQVDLAARRAVIREAARLKIARPVFINFTPTSIYDPHFCLRTTVAAIKEAGIPPGNVVFEVIESEHVPDIGHLRNIMDYYREQGFRVALDDLGSGYSSLNMLSALQPDYVKLDMGLVRGVHADRHRALIAAKLLEVAQGLSIISIAEGVETAEEFEWLIRHGADLVQGYHFARPANPPAL
jgi:EAL domain-containing protein (putative c-di-GMP-specific phosphodiesterase class I)